MDKKKSFQFFTDIAYNQPMDFIASERKSLKQTYIQRKRAEFIANFKMNPYAPRREKSVKPKETE